MSGAVNAVVDVAKKVTDIGSNNPVMKAIKDVPILGEVGRSVDAFNQSGVNVLTGIKDKQSAGKIIAGSAKPFVDRAKSLAGPVIGEIKGGQQGPVNIAAPVDVAAEEEKAKQDRIQADIVKAKANIAKRIQQSKEQVAAADSYLKDLGAGWKRITDSHKSAERVYWGGEVVWEETYNYDNVLYRD